ncbi:MAG TPA: outer membrane beta-barrel protein [Thermoanaerobaculia bacterium]|nr:outer membrane beta-barrel protein [Thermoanaerobaculia bacterium]
MTRHEAGGRNRASSSRVAARLLAMLVLAALATAARAQTPGPDVAGPWQASAFGGGWNSITAPYTYRTPAGPAEVGFGNAPAFGLSFGRDASRLLGIELSWTQTNPAQQYTTSPPTPIRNVIMNIVELDSLWYFRRGTFQPYGILGFGGAGTGSSFGGTNLTIALGIGVKAFLSPHIAVRADIRWDNMYGNVGHAGDPAFCDSAGCYFYRTSWYSSLPVTAGITYAF